MPQELKIGPYTIYFWSNEGNPLEPIHVQEANSSKIIEDWISLFGEIRYYC